MGWIPVFDAFGTKRFATALFTAVLLVAAVWPKHFEKAGDTSMPFRDSDTYSFIQKQVKYP